MIAAIMEIVNAIIGEPGSPTCRGWTRRGRPRRVVLLRQRRDAQTRLSSPLIARYEPANAIQPLRRVADRGMRVDRAMAIGAQAYTALIPLLIVYASLLPRADNEDFADTMIKEFELTGTTAASFKRAFAPAIKNTPRALPVAVRDLAVPGRAPATPRASFERQCADDRARLRRRLILRRVRPVQDARDARGSSSRRRRG
jgi:hypothetical protein